MKHTPVLLLTVLLLICLSGCGKDEQSALLGTEGIPATLPEGIYLPTYPEKETETQDSNRPAVEADPWRENLVPTGDPVSCPLTPTGNYYICTVPGIQNNKVQADGNRVYLVTPDDVHVTMGLTDVSFEPGETLKDTAFKCIDLLMADMTELRKSSCKEFSYEILKNKEDTINGRTYQWMLAELNYLQFGDSRTEKMICYCTQLSDGSYAYFSTNVNAPDFYVQMKEVALELAYSLMEIQT